MPRIKPLALVALFCVLCVMLISRGRAQQAAPPQTQPAESKVKADLVSQLVATAKEARKQAETEYRAGLATPEEIHIWTMRLIDARLMAAKDKKSRLEVFKVRAAMAEKWEKELVDRRLAGAARELDVTEARYSRLEAQIDLADEQTR